VAKPSAATTATATNPNMPAILSFAHHPTQ
jgi:hypothetical protein